MHLKQLLHRKFQAAQVGTLIQLVEKRQVCRGISTHDIGKIELQVGQRIYWAHRVIHLVFPCSLLCKCLQLQHGCVLHQII